MGPNNWKIANCFTNNDVTNNIISANKTQLKEKTSEKNFRYVGLAVSFRIIADRPNVNQ